MTDYAITVTQEHIDAGSPRMCNTCPVALAIKAATPYKHYVVVQSGEVWLSTDPDRPASHWAKLPEKVKTWITRFDSEAGKVKPFTFTLRVRES